MDHFLHILVDWESNKPLDRPPYSSTWFRYLDSTTWFRYLDSTTWFRCLDSTTGSTYLNSNSNCAIAALTNACAEWEIWFSSGWR